MHCKDRLNHLAIFFIEYDFAVKVDYIANVLYIANDYIANVTKGQKIYI